MNSPPNRIANGYTGLASPFDRITGLGRVGKVALAFVVILLIALLLLGGVFAVGTFFFYDSYASTYSYDVSIDVDGETESVDLLIPLPVYDGEAQLGDVYISERERFEGVDHAVVDTEHGPMLQLEIDKIRDGPHWHTLSLSTQVEIDESIDTKNPRETEPVLSPVELVERDLDETIHDRWPDRVDFDATSTAYIAHSGEDDVEIGISVWYRGGNDWWTFGWNGNYYETSVVGGLDAPDSDGVWVDLHGRHIEGAGNYPTFPPAPS